MTDSVQQQKLCRISQQGMRQAAEMLSRLLRQPVEVEVADIWMSDSKDSLDLPTGPQLGVYMQVSGDLSGGMLLAFSEDCASWLCSQLLRSESGDLLGEPASSTLREVGNIFASSFLASIDDQLGLRALPSPPQLSCAQIEELLKRCQPNAREACLIVRTRLRGEVEAGASLQAAIYLFPEETALKRLRDQIEV